MVADEPRRLTCSVSRVKVGQGVLCPRSHQVQDNASLVSRVGGHDGAEEGADLGDPAQPDRGPAWLRPDMDRQGTLGERREEVLVGPVVADATSSASAGARATNHGTSRPCGRRASTSMTFAPSRIATDAGLEEERQLERQGASLAGAQLRVGEPVVPRDPAPSPPRAPREFAPRRHA